MYNNADVAQNDQQELSLSQKLEKIFTDFIHYLAGYNVIDGLLGGGLLQAAAGMRGSSLVVGMAVGAGTVLTSKNLSSQLRAYELLENQTDELIANLNESMAQLNAELNARHDGDVEELEQTQTHIVDRGINEDVAESFGNEARENQGQRNTPKP